jgi:3-oxoacyl-[acyl-carrier protein] reductase
MRAPVERSVALVTGASRGIGRAIALALAERFDIVAVARSHALLDALAEEIAAGGGRCEALPLDVGDGPAVGAALEGRRVDVLVHNAGVGIMKPFTALTADEWRTMIATNVDALYHVTHALLPGMIERRAGHIIAIASISGRTPLVNGACYSATKHAVMGFTESLMLEVREFGVKVSVVLPGSVDTHFSSRPQDASWKLSPSEVADAVIHVLDTPYDVLIHRVEIRALFPPPKR